MPGGTSTVGRASAPPPRVGVDSHYDRPVRVERFELTYLPGHAGGEFNVRLANDREVRMNNAIREQLNCFVIGADRRLQYQLSYANAWTLLSKLMRRFHQSLLSDEDRAARLRQHFESLHQIFHEVREFSSFASQLEDEVAALSTNLRYGLEVDFSAYDPSNMFKALRVQPKLGKDRLTFDELGTGQEQILALAFAYAYARAFGSDAGLLLVIEEPEAHLHPLAQEWLASQLTRFVAAGAQVLVTTHSPTFVNVRSLNGMVVIRKNAEGASEATQLGRPELKRYCVSHGAPTSIDAVTILDYYDAAATAEIKAGFFARGVVLVEGPTEALALPVLMRKCGIELSKLGIAIVPVGGKGNLAKWWRLFTAYEVPTFLIFDNDAAEDGDARRRKDALSTVGVEASDQPRFLEADTLTIERNFAVFGRDFETTMRFLFPTYAVLEAEGRTIVGGSKPLLARWVAERLDPSGAPFLELAETLRSLVPASTQNP